MVNVYTKNGNFDISESLMEAIKDNNPEILLEKKKDKNDKNSAIRDLENRAIGEVNDNLLNFSLRYVLSNIPVDSMSEEEYGKLYNAVTKYYSMDDSPEKKLQKSRIKSFLNDINEKNGTDFDFKKNIEDEVNNEYQSNANKIKDLNKDEALKYFAKMQQNIASRAIDLEKQLEKQEREEKEQRDIERKLRKHNVNDAEDQILFQQILKNGGDISDGIEIDGKKLTHKEVERRIKRNPYFDKAWKEFENNKDAKKEIAKNAEEINKAKEETSIKNQDYAPETLEDLLNSQGLIDEINMTESAAKKLVETSKECISDILGLIGNTQRNNSSNLVKNTFNDKKTNNVNDNIQTQQNLKKAVGEAVNTSTSAISDTNFDTSNIANDNKNSKSNNLSYKPNATGASRYTKGIGALLTGGFNIKPLFNGNPSDKQHFGMSMKYYKEYTKSKNNNSLIDNLMDYLIEKHSNKDDFEKHIEEQLISKYGKKLSKPTMQNKIQTLSNDLDRISANFLGNVVYRLEVGNDNTFNEIMRAIRFAPKIKEKYYVSNESKLQMFGVREQALIFKNINSESVVSIFIATPLLARATELGKQALKLTRHFKNIKA